MRIVLPAILREVEFSTASSACFCKSEIEREPHHENPFMHRLGQARDELFHLIERPIEVIVGRTLITPVHRGGGIAAGTEHPSTRPLVQAGRVSMLELFAQAPTRRRC